MAAARSGQAPPGAGSSFLPRPAVPRRGRARRGWVTGPVPTRRP